MCRAIIQLKQKEMVFLLPAFFYTGTIDGIFSGSYTKDIITRTMGIGAIGFVMTIFGIVNVLSCFIIGKLADRFNTTILVVIGTLAHMIFFVIIFVILETEGLIYFIPRSYLIYIGAGLGGLGDAAFTTFSTTTTSKLFSHNIEAASAACKFSQSLGSAIFFIIGPYGTIQVKMTIFLGFLCMAIISLGFRRIFIGPIEGKSNFETDEHKLDNVRDEF